MIGSKGASRVALAMAAAALVGFVHGQMDTSSAAEQGRLRVPDAGKAKALALGFEPVIADYYWVQAIQMVGGVERVPGRGEQVGDLIELVTTLDPWVDHPYRFAALWLTESADEVRRANEILAKGIAYHPDEWRNRFYLGYNHFFYLEDNQQAADILESALAYPEAPDYLGAFVTRLRASVDSLDTAALFLQQLIGSTDDEYARAGYLKAFDEIETERRARILDQARDLFRKRHGRDIESPEELWAGPLRVMPVMPPPHPHFEGFFWELEEESGEIVSSFYGTRYRVHVHMADERRRRKWRDESEETAGPGGAST